MTGSTRLFTTLLLVGLALVAPARTAPVASLPDRLTDTEFWKLRADISEPGGYFRITDNFTSNEGEVGQLFSMLRQKGVQGGVYLGVGPEQNFSYIASIRPSMAFIVDIRRQAAMQHLLFKAIFELSWDRAEFIALLFSKPRPAGLTSTSSIHDIWNAYSKVETDRALATTTATRLVNHLTATHAFPLAADEVEEIRWVLDAFVAIGPQISTRGSGGGGGGNNWSFADLTGWAIDDNGVPQSFLSTDEHFRTVRTLHERNLIVPITGDFGGPKALRAIGTYLKAQGARVSAFYVSNVEQYLFQDGKNRAFYDNVAALPLDETSVFIRPYSMRRGGGGVTESLCVMPGFLRAAAAGRVFSNNDALACVN